MLIKFEVTQVEMHHRAGEMGKGNNNLRLHKHKPTGAEKGIAAYLTGTTTPSRASSRAHGGPSPPTPPVKEDWMWGVAKNGAPVALRG